MKRFILAFTSFAALCLGASAQNDAPYLYYYVPLLNAFVIERADGADSRLFAQGVVPGGHQAVRDLGWSPNGEQFAVLSAPEYLTGGIITRFNVSLTSIDGQRATFLDGLDQLTDGYWSAEQDVLYLIEYRFDGDVVYRADVASATVEQVRGDSIEAPPAQEPPIDSSAGDFLPSPDGRFQIDPRTADLIDVTAGTTVPMRRHSGYSANDMCGVEWHREGAWFLRHDSMIYAGGGCPYGIVVADTTGRTQRELTACPLGSDCGGWLPERVAARLGPGQPAPVVPEPRLTLSVNGDVTGVGWRADGAALAAVEEVYGERGMESTLRLWSLDGDAPALIRSLDIGSCFRQIFSNCEVEWSPDGARIALASEDGVQLVTVESGAVEDDDRIFAGWTTAGEPVLVDSFVDADYDASRGRVALIAPPDDAGGRRIDVVDTTDGSVIHTMRFQDQRALIHGVNLLPNGFGATVAVGSSQLVWTFADDSLRPLNESPGSYITDSRPYGTVVIGFGRAALTHVFDAVTGELVAWFNRYAYDVALSPDGRTLATAGGQGVSLWDVSGALAP